MFTTHGQLKKVLRDIEEKKMLDYIEKNDVPNRVMRMRLCSGEHWYCNCAFCGDIRKYLISHLDEIYATQVHHPEREDRM